MKYFIIKDDKGSCTLLGEMELEVSKEKYDSWKGKKRTDAVHCCICTESITETGTGYNGQPAHIECYHRAKKNIITDRWFAWRPVKTTNAGWVWFRTVIRTIDNCPVTYLGLLPEYTYSL